MFNPHFLGFDPDQNQDHKLLSAFEQTTKHLKLKYFPTTLVPQSFSNYKLRGNNIHILSHAINKLSKYLSLILILIYSSFVNKEPKLNNETII